MNFFLVNQNHDSRYEDEVGKRYHYPTRIPNGKKIAVNDILIFSMSKSDARKNGDENKRISGIAQIENIDLFTQNNKEQAIATYEWFVGFEEFLTFDEIGGDPRNNIQNAMSKIVDEDVIAILISMIRKRTK